ncbi:MAG: ComF family protein [Actinomycetota bacterium]|jgi:ComF family protein|nr:ComF family protein [Actinomycetota bacterium]
MGVLAEGLRELLWPTRCAGCDLPGSLLCDACREAIALVDPTTACERCGAPHGWLVCTECWNSEFPFTDAVSAGLLQAPLSRMVTLHKDSNERRLAEVLAELLAAPVLERGWKPDVVCGVPASKAAIARRGFDHGSALAGALARRLDRPHEQLLTRGRALDQRGLDREQRAVNASDSFQVAAQPLGRDILVVDDVLTTGATLSGAAACLLDAGASRVRTAVVARVW